MKRRIESYSFYDHTGIAAHLEDMAARGWMLKSVGAFTWNYEKCEPVKARFAVTYYPRLSEFDPADNPDLASFAEFCARTGWKFVCSKAQMQFYVNFEDEPRPIDTDPALELANIHASARKSFIFPYALLLALGLLVGAMWLSTLIGDPVSLLASGSQLLTGFCWLVLGLLCAAELAVYYRWRRRALEAAARGEFLPTRGTTGLQRFVIWAVALMLAYWLLNLLFTGNRLMLAAGLSMLAVYAAIALAVNAAKGLMKRKNAPRGVNRTVSIVLSFVLSFALIYGVTGGLLKLTRAGAFTSGGGEGLPLTLEELLGEEELPGHVARSSRDGSVFISRLSVYQSPREYAPGGVNERLDYTLTEARLPSLCGAVEQSLLDEGGPSWEYRECAAAPFGADKAYRRCDTELNSWGNDYLLRYDNRFVELSPSFELEPGQMELVGEAFGK